MKTTDLMVGDWVQNQGGLIKGKIVNIDAYQNRVEFGANTIDADFVYPIPLTPEILEKNGFEKVNESVFRIYNYSANLRIGINFDEFKNNMPIIYLLDNNTDSWPGYHQYDLFDCQYVHKFQHILKDLEIEKEIIL